MERWRRVVKTPKAAVYSWQSGVLSISVLPAAFLQLGQTFKEDAGLEYIQEHQSQGRLGLNANDYNDTRAKGFYREVLGIKNGLSPIEHLSNGSSSP